MNTLKKFTIRSLKMNKKRTIVTIIGIILSVALICSVAGIFLSFQKSLIEESIKTDGKYHTRFENVSVDKLDIVKNNKKIESYYYEELIGYGSMVEENKDIEYLHIQGYDAAGLKNSGLQLEKGRLPKNDTEIVITKGLNIHSTTQYKIGDKLNLNMFNIEFGDIPIDEETTIWGELSKEELFTKEYTIVGVTSSSYYVMGYIPAITKIDQPSEKINLYVYYKNVKDMDVTNQVLVKDFNLTSDDVHLNSELLRWLGSFDEETLTILYGIAAIIIAIIMLTSIFVIKNGFSISVAERIKEYGILSSIGATKKQIKKSILYEGFILGLIAIPLGILVGIGAVYILIFLVSQILKDMLEMELLYIIPYQAIIISIILGFLTIYLSVFLIARKTSKIAPIESIRNSESIKIKSKKLKTPKIIKALFKTGGIIAYKNMKRNKKRNRTTVVSMIISIVLFVGMSSLVNNVFSIAIKEFALIDFNIYMTGNQDFYENALSIGEDLGKQKYAIVREKIVKIDKKYINDNINNYIMIDEDNIPLYSIGKEAYSDYIKKIGGTYEEYKDKIIMVDNNLFKEKSKIISEKVFNIQEELLFTDSSNDNKTTTLSVITTDKLPLPFPTEDQNHYLIISDEMMDKLGYDKYGYIYMVIDAKDSYATEKAINSKYSHISIQNYDEHKKYSENLILVISIFLYGFIAIITIIGVTNIINTLTTSLNLRKKEFAILRSIGTTSKEFRQIINLESIFLGTKVLIIGLPIGILISYLIYYNIARVEAIHIKYDPNIMVILISVISVLLIIKAVMSYTMKHINKQNIIETIRNDNI